jgi:hypothetical protein
MLLLLYYYAFYVGLATFAGGVGVFIKMAIKKFTITYNGVVCPMDMTTIVFFICMYAFASGLYVGLLPLSLYCTSKIDNQIIVNYKIINKNFPEIILTF